MYFGLLRTKPRVRGVTVVYFTFHYAHWPYFPLTLVRQSDFSSTQRPEAKPNGDWPSFRDTAREGPVLLTSLLSRRGACHLLIFCGYISPSRYDYR